MKKSAALLGLVAAQALAPTAFAQSNLPDPNAGTVNQANMAPRSSPEMTPGAGANGSTAKPAVDPAALARKEKAEKTSNHQPTQAAVTREEREQAALARHRDGRAAAHDSEQSPNALPREADGAPKPTARQPG